MSENAVIEGAILKCSLGTENSIFRVPVNHGAQARGGNMAIISDSKENVNIMPFGMCRRSIPHAACSPVIFVKWLNGKQDSFLDKEMVLIDRSMLPCSNGGIITIQNDGQQ